MLKLNHINKYYNAGTVNEMCLFRDFNLSIEDGQFVSVVGSNGSGKTSMLNIICGSIPVDQGTIEIGGGGSPHIPAGQRPPVWTSPICRSTSVSGGSAVCTRIRPEEPVRI